MQHPSVYAEHAKALKLEITEAETKVLCLYAILHETEELEKASRAQLVADAIRVSSEKAKVFNSSSIQ